MPASCPWQPSLSNLELGEVTQLLRDYVEASTTHDVALVNTNAEDSLQKYLFLNNTEGTYQEKQIDLDNNEQLKSAIALSLVLSLLCAVGGASAAIHAMSYLAGL